MARKARALKQKDKIILGMEDNEKALLSIILMNKGRISETKLKRVYLDKYSLWEMQNSEKKLSEKGFLIKNAEIKSGEEFEYKVPSDLVKPLYKSLVSKGLKPERNIQLEPFSSAYFGEYSILWYLWKMDNELNYGLLISKTDKRSSGAFNKKTDENLGIERNDQDLLKFLLVGLSKSRLLAENGYKKWSDVLDSPHAVVKELFKIGKDSLKEGNGFGKEEVGKDNIDFLFEELTALKIGQWYSIKAFVSNARSTLFTVNQPFRWIHFGEDSVWRVLDQKLRTIGIVETAIYNNGEKYIMPTTVGGYSLGKLSERKLLKIFSSRREKLIVHPNFEVTAVLRELDPKVALELAMFSKPIKSDTVSVFRITKDSVREGFRLGLTTDEMTSFLKENSKGEVPQNVEYSIKDWGK